MSESERLRLAQSQSYLTSLSASTSLTLSQAESTSVMTSNQISESASTFLWTTDTAHRSQSMSLMASATASLSTMLAESAKAALQTVTDLATSEAAETAAVVQVRTSESLAELEPHRSPQPVITTIQNTGNRTNLVGTGERGARITVLADGSSYMGRVDRDGNWQVAALDPDAGDMLSVTQTIGDRPTSTPVTASVPSATQTPQPSVGYAFNTGTMLALAGEGEPHATITVAGTETLTTDVSGAGQWMISVPLTAAGERLSITQQVPDATASAPVALTVPPAASAAGDPSQTAVGQLVESATADATGRARRRVVPQSVTPNAPTKTSASVALPASTSASTAPAPTPQPDEPRSRAERRRAEEANPTTSPKRHGLFGWGRKHDNH